MDISKKLEEIETNFNKLNTEKESNNTRNLEIDTELFRLQWEFRLLQEMEKETETKNKPKKK